MTNKAIYIEMADCGQCITAKPKFLAECERLNIPVTIKDAENRETTEIGEIKSMPYAIVTYNGEVIRGNAWDVIDKLRTL